MRLKDTLIFDYKVTDKPKGGPVLATVEGYATFNDKENGNRRFYPTKNGESFWTRILDKDSRIQEMIKTKTFFGCAKHPGEKDSPLPEFEEISHCITSYKVDDIGCWIKADVLNTKPGRVIGTLLDYGSKLGVSTRAFGDQEEDKQGRLIPVEDKYHFVTWDFVVFPAFSDARMKQVSDSMEIDPVVLNDSKIYSFSEADILDKMKDLSYSDQKSLCDYLGLECKDQKICSGCKTSENKDLESAIEKVISLEDEVKTLKSGIDSKNPILNRISANKKYINDWNFVDIDEKDLALSKIKSEFDLELKDIYDSYNKLEDNNLELRELVGELKLEYKNVIGKTLREKRILSDKVKELSIELDYIKKSLNDEIRKKEEAIELAENINDDYENSLATIDKISKREKTLVDQLKQTEILLESHQESPKNQVRKNTFISDSKNARPMFKPFSDSVISEENDEEIKGLVNTINKVNLKTKLED